ncbi:MAG: 4-(cytidine 5'-diphospho)-2-C-methyl-D-erythritol kinase [Thermoflavifilum sp.]|nr:4-(cytidine 5'-diphospho)-2-C-methyl-D-erythritol kinase [Thermoflavifilum sp.]
MIAFSPAKINLGLQILAPREDGYHEIETIFYPVPWYEAIEIITASATQLHLSGIPLPGDPASNLCLRAYRVMKNDFPNLPEIDIYLHKTIPPGTGLGSGSANAAYTLKLLNNKFQLGLSDTQLLTYAQQLGSDCGFFLQSTPCLATGRGDRLSPIDLQLTGYDLLIVCPNMHISTAWAYQQVQPTPHRPSLKSWITQPIETWKEHLINDFEIPIFQHFPELKHIKQQLYAAGACYASLSGSGSALFGLFRKGSIPSTLQFEKAVLHVCSL